MTQVSTRGIRRPMLEAGAGHVSLQSSNLQTMTQSLVSDRSTLVNVSTQPDVKYEDFHPSLPSFFHISKGREPHLRFERKRLTFNINV